MESSEKKSNDLLRYQREKRGWSQRKLAEKLDTTDHNVSRWERGERSPSPFYQEKLCALFGKDAEELGFLDIVKKPEPTSLATSVLPDATSTDHYLARLGTQRATQFLEEACEQESNKWVQRGIMVGLALYCERADVLDRYIKIVRQDPEVASINIGYHLVYYGDQLQELGYYDHGITKCDETIKALFRRLRNERYKSGWALDLLTLSALLESRGQALLSSREWQLSFLQAFLREDYHELGTIFQQEKDYLRNLVDGESHEYEKHRELRV